MNPLARWPDAVLLFADFDSLLRGFGSEFRGKNARLGWQDGMIVLLIVAVLAAAVIALSRYLQRKDRMSRESHPGRLFGELCAAHGIDFRDRRALKQLARFHKLQHPATLFLTPSLFDARPSHAELQNCRDRLARLRDRLFPISPTETSRP